MCIRVGVTPEGQTDLIPIARKKLLQPPGMNGEYIIIKHDLFNGQILFCPLKFINNQINRFTPQGVFPPEHILIFTFNTKMAGERTAPLGHDGIGSGLFGVIVPLYRIFVDIDSALNRPIGHN